MNVVLVFLFLVFHFKHFTSTLTSKTIDNEMKFITLHQKYIKKPTNCGTKAADVLPIFLAGNIYNANQLNILVCLQVLAAIPMSSFDPHFDPQPHLGGKVDQRGQK